MKHRMEETHLVYAQRAVQKDFFFEKYFKKTEYEEKKVVLVLSNQNLRTQKRFFSFFWEKHIPNKLSHVRDKDIT